MCVSGDRNAVHINDNSITQPPPPGTTYNTGNTTVKIPVELEIDSTSGAAVDNQLWANCLTASIGDSVNVTSYFPWPVTTINQSVKVNTNTFGPPINDQSTSILVYTNYRITYNGAEILRGVTTAVGDTHWQFSQGTRLIQGGTGKMRVAFQGTDPPYKGDGYTVEAVDVRMYHTQADFTYPTPPPPVVLRIETGLQRLSDFCLYGSLGLVDPIVIPPPEPPPNAPTTPSKYDVCEGTQVTINGFYSTGADSYNIYNADGDTLIGTTTDSTYVITGLTLNQLVQVYVTAVNANGESEPSGILSIIACAVDVYPPPPVPPQGMNFDCTDIPASVMNCNL